MAEAVSEKVIEIIAEQAMIDPSEIAISDRLDTLGVDSLGLVEAIFSIEEAFNIQVPFNANDTENKSFDISTVQSIVEGVEALIKEAG